MRSIIAMEILKMMFARLFGVLQVYLAFYYVCLHNKFFWDKPFKIAIFIIRHYYIHLQIMRAQEIILRNGML